MNRPGCLIALALIGHFCPTYVGHPCQFTQESIDADPGNLSEHLSISRDLECLQPLAEIAARLDQDTEEVEAEYDTELATLLDTPLFLARPSPTKTKKILISMIVSDNHGQRFHLYQKVKADHTLTVKKLFHVLCDLWQENCRDDADVDFHFPSNFTLGTIQGLSPYTGEKPADLALPYVDISEESIQIHLQVEQVRKYFPGTIAITRRKGLTHYYYEGEKVDIRLPHYHDVGDLLKTDI